MRYANVFEAMITLPDTGLLVARSFNMHETKAITVTEVIKREHLGNRRGARHCRAGTESKRRFLGVIR